ncbi:hypothetical protein [Fusobacterium necrophorum]|uniref:Uncharacterized protein n=1 Tax=Fusobacterium necrophorum TaxID=859 RepID=A0A4Q2KX46_9FUSO|nr:hypothetical protein [Fusobacterium necrophorum]RXZ68422.1 hypothetical protein EPT53_09865 [Fusobacterium necrophorum]
MSRILELEEKRKKIQDLINQEKKNQKRRNNKRVTDFLNKIHSLEKEEPCFVETDFLDEQNFPYLVGIIMETKNFSLEEEKKYRKIGEKVIMKLYPRKIHEKEKKQEEEVETKNGK